MAHITLGSKRIAAGGLIPEGLGMLFPTDGQWPIQLRQFTDTVSVWPGRFVFPSGCVLHPTGPDVIWCETLSAPFLGERWRGRWNAGDSAQWYVGSRLVITPTGNAERLFLPLTGGCVTVRGGWQLAPTVTPIRLKVETLPTWDIDLNTPAQNLFDSLNIETAGSINDKFRSVGTLDPTVLPNPISLDTAPLDDPETAIDLSDPEMLVEIHSGSPAHHRMTPKRVRIFTDRPFRIQITVPGGSVGILGTDASIGYVAWSFSPSSLSPMDGAR